MPLLFFDTTRSARWKHSSGLGRTGNRLLRELQAILGERVTPVYWETRQRTFLDARNKQRPNWREGVFFTPEVFAEGDRPGIGAWLSSTSCHKAALFHDAIPLRFPEFTWPRSVVRHPYYMQQLLQFDQVLAVSEDAGRDLAAYWTWCGHKCAVQPQVLQLGADFLPGKSGASRERGKAVLVPGIIEPRKGQDLAMRAMERVWAEDPTVELHLAGRLNPHFGKPILRQLQDLKRQGRPIRWHKGANDTELLDLFQQAGVVMIPSRAEGYGLGVIESLWLQRPVIASPHVPAARRWAGQGVTIVDALEPVLFAKAVQHTLKQPPELPDAEIIPQWADTAKQLVAALG